MAQRPWAEDAGQLERPDHGSALVKAFGARPGRPAGLTESEVRCMWVRTTVAGLDRADGLLTPGGLSDGGWW